MQVYRPSFKYDVPANPKGKVVRAAKRRIQPNKTLTVPKHRLEFLTACLQAMEWQAKNMTPKNEVLLPKNLGEVRKLLAGIVEEAKARDARSRTVAKLIKVNKGMKNYTLADWHALNERLDSMNSRQLNAWRIQLVREAKEVRRLKKAAKLAA